MYTCNFTGRFKKDYKRSVKRGWNMKLFEDVYDLLEDCGEIPADYKPHPLSGKWDGFMDAHIQPDWVLIYKVDKQKNEIDFVRMGTHSDLF
ncbi:MAG: type II toxin-antitoxin system YafQ family toxin [Bacteroidales bacterium]|nr:type II toxin-antitoxin system YafQ family toxin [Bacteroidales bacterium]MCF8456106.1 type II toxin-antitoxin system YafQ family toxin [Bacteroidales bacterium]